MHSVDEADCYLTYDVDKDYLVLWLPPIDPRQVVWVGRGSNIKEALAKYDIDNAVYSPDLVSYMESWAENNKGSVYILHRDQATKNLSSTSRLNTTDLQPAMDECRVFKDSFEVELITKANAISAMAHEEVLRRLLTFHNESQVEATFLGVSISQGARHQAYDPIAGSGPNAATLHYVKNDEDFEGRQLMCLDAGAEWNCYASDVTRTFSLSGRWPSEEAKSIYMLVQRMQSEAMSLCGPGKQFLSAHYAAHMIAIQGLLALGIFHNGTASEIFKAGTSLAFFPHGLGHHLGLEVHDVAPTGTIPLTLQPLFESYSEDWKYHLTNTTAYRAPCQMGRPPLAPGMVVTVEPGIYFNATALSEIFLPSPVHSKYINQDVLQRYMPVGGVRIEDDILITPEGYTNLTTAAKGEAALQIIRGEA